MCTHIHIYNFIYIYIYVLRVGGLVQPGNRFVSFVRVREQLYIRSEWISKTTLLLFPFPFLPCSDFFSFSFALLTPIPLSNFI